MARPAGEGRTVVNEASRHRLPPGTWSMLPEHVVANGALRTMSVAQSRVFIAMVLRANWNEGGRVIVSQEQLSHDTGIQPRNIRKATKALNERDVVRTLHTGSGPGNCSEYLIVSGNPDAGISLSSDKSGSPHPGKGGHRGFQRRTRGVSKADVGVPPKEVRMKKEERRRAAGAASDQTGEEHSQTVKWLLNASRSD